MNYVELHLHDHYSALDGLNTPAEYMTRAKEIGMTHLAETNHGTTAGWREFQREADKAGIIPILGVEAYISSTDRFDRRATNKREDGTNAFNHIGLLAMNESGLQNVNNLMSEAWKSGFYHKPRIDMELLEQYSDDVIVLSGCLNGLLSKALEQNDYDRALKTAQKLVNIFGERFFIEVQGHNPEEINAGLLRLSEDTGARPVVTSDCHYARKEDLWVQEAILILSTKPKADSKFDFSKSQKMDILDRYNYIYPERKMTFQEIEIYLHSAEEHMAALAKQGIGKEPIENTQLVANMIGDYPYYDGLDLLPKPDADVEDLDAELERLVKAGLAKRGLIGNPEYVKRAKEELAVIRQKGFATYFLILADVIQWALSRGIFIGPGRGSGVSSLVNYALGITNIDPIKYKLLFFRFMDPDRDDWPDIDVDFEVKRRYEVKDYVSKKYGYAANIMTFGYFRGKAAIKAAASVFKIPTGEVNRATAHLVDDDDYPVLEAYEKSPATAEFRKKYPEVLPLAKALEGRIKSIGMHAGGTVLSKEPFENFIAVQTAKDPHDEAGERVPVISADMNEAANIGLIKYDFLGLNNLTVITETINSIKERTGKVIDPYQIPLDDENVYKMLSQGHTKAVFQCEGGPYTRMLVEMGGVDNFEDLISSNALVRPGAANSSIGENYIKGKNTGNFEYIHADTKYFTEDTFGQILFQEQQMLLCTEVAGMSMRDANQVRQAIGKKKADKLAIWKPAFIEGAAKKIGQRKAEAVWNDLEKSAEYAFNRAHSVGYSLISYWTAWFKVNYPTEYMNAVLNNITASKDKKVKAMFYLLEAKRLGVTIKLPHINASGVNNTIEGDAIRLGLSTIKGIADKTAHKLIELRPFDNYSQLAELADTPKTGVGWSQVSALNKIGAASFEDNPKTGEERSNFYEYLNIPAFNSQDLPAEIKAQFRPLNEFTEDEAFIVCGMVYNIRSGRGWALVEMIDESGSAGAFMDENTPMEKGVMYVMLIANNRVARYITTDELIEGKGGAFAKFLEAKKLQLDEGQYRCISYKTRTTKAGKKMADAVFTDADKNLLPALVFPQMVEKATILCATASKCRPTFAEARGGGIYLQEIK